MIFHASGKNDPTLQSALQAPIRKPTLAGKRFKN